MYFKKLPSQFDKTTSNRVSACFFFFFFVPALFGAAGAKSEISSPKPKLSLQKDPNPKPQFRFFESHLMRASLVITGLSVRWCDCSTIASLWERIIAAADYVKAAPPDRTHNNSVMSSLQTTPATIVGVWCEPFDLFDASFFHILPREAALMDPSHRFALMCAFEAMESAGLPCNHERKFGVYEGLSNPDFLDSTRKKF